MANDPMQQVVGFMPEMQDITRQREMAKLLMQQGQAPLQGQMIGNKYVAPSPWEGIANLFSTYKANKLAKEADTKQAQLAELIRKGTAEDMLKYNELMYGKEGTADVVPQGQTLRDDQGNLTYGAQQGIAPVAANPRAAYEFALQSRFPQVNAYATEMQKPQKLGAEETLQRFNPITGKMEVIGQGAPKASADIRTAAALVGLGNKDPSTWTQQELNLVNQKVVQLNQSKTQPIMVNTGKDLSGQIGDIMKTSKADTVAAQKTLNSANKIESFANSPSFKGVGADVKLQLAQIGDALGFTGAETQQKINNTRQGVQELGRLAVMASSNKGQGAVSDYERQLYARVAGGDINLTKGELMLVANAAREGANYTIQQHQNQINYMKSNPELKPLVPFYDVPAVSSTPSAPTQSGTFDFKAAAQEEARKRGILK